MAASVRGGRAIGQWALRVKEMCEGVVSRVGGTRGWSMVAPPVRSWVV